MSEPWLEVRELTRAFPTRRGAPWKKRRLLRALDGVDLQVSRGECLGIVGESGGGKTTLGRCLVRLLEPTSGSIRLGGQDLLALNGETLRRGRRRFQMVFQDPYSSLNPRLTVGQAVREPLTVHRIVPSAERNQRVEELLDLVGLDPVMAERYPHELSGGQRQRVGIGRALATEPELVVADEPVSSLDVSVQAQVLALLRDLKARFGLTLVFISHDLAVVQSIADRVAVLYLGRVVELAPTQELFSLPLHPYTGSLLWSAPQPDPAGRKKKAILRGEVPSPVDPPSGCRFHPRCPVAEPICGKRCPHLRGTVSSDGRPVTSRVEKDRNIEVLPCVM